MSSLAPPLQPPASADAEIDSPSPRGEGRGEGKLSLIQSQHARLHRRRLSPHPNPLPEERENECRVLLLPRSPQPLPMRNSILPLLGERAGVRGKQAMEERSHPSKGGYCQISHPGETVGYARMFRPGDVCGLFRKVSPGRRRLPNGPFVSTLQAMTPSSPLRPIPNKNPRCSSPIVPNKHSCFANSKKFLF